MLRKLALAATVCALLAACGEAPRSGVPVTLPLPSPTPVGIETPAGASIYLGAYVPPGVGGITTLETAIGRTLAIGAHYYNWVSLFPGLQESADIANGRLSLDSWNCGVPNAQIAAGLQDMLIVTRAQAIQALGRPVFLRFDWDPNLPAATLARTGCLDPATDGATTFSPSEYVAAYRHIHDLFVQHGVTNAIWVWSYAASGADPTAYYPGPSYVDWVGVDVYQSGSSDFPSTFGPQYTFASQFGKPIVISETGAASAEQSAYVSSMMPSLQTQYPQVKAVVYYDGSLFGTNWALSSAGSTAFAALAADPYLNAFGVL